MFGRMLVLAVALAVGQCGAQEYFGDARRMRRSWRRVVRCK
jgi:hypothetical protein